MTKNNHYQDLAEHPLLSIVKGIDRDVERCEDILMLGYGFVLMAPIFAPITPPHILLPLMALALVISVCTARRRFHAIQNRLSASMLILDKVHIPALQPVVDVFAEHPKQSLSEGFNPLTNLARTIKSILGSLLINPFWMPIFYTLGLQFAEEKQLHLLNRKVIQLERETANWS